MKKKPLGNGKFSKEGDLSDRGDWASIIPNRAFRSLWLRESFPLNEPVLYLKETVTRCDDFAEGEYMITIVCNHNQKQYQVPLSLLCLNERQKEELVVYNLVSKEYFSLLNQNCLDGAYIKANNEGFNSE